MNEHNILERLKEIVQEYGTGIDKMDEKTRSLVFGYMTSEIKGLIDLLEDELGFD